MLQFTRLHPKVVHVYAEPWQQFLGKHQQTLIQLPESIETTMMVGTVLTPPNDGSLELGDTILIQSIGRGNEVFMQSLEGKKYLSEGEYLVSLDGALAKLTPVPHEDTAV